MTFAKKAGQQLNVISRITLNMDFPKRHLLGNAYLYLQFNYCQLVWMCQNRANNNKINRLHERRLCLIYNDKKSPFKDLLEKDGSVSIHHRNLRTLAVELFKAFKGLSPVIFAEAFPVRQQSQYNMRNYSYFAMPHAKTVNHGLESLSYLGSKLWDSIPSHMKELMNLTLLMNLNMPLKLGNLICAHADFAKFIYKTLDICSQRLFPFALRYTFPFLV